MAEKKQNKGGCFIATGRRKKSIARVRLYPGSGKIEINGRGIEEYLQRDTLILIAKQPLTLTATAEKFDVVVNFAAESHVDRSITDPEIFVKTNVMGTTTLLDAAKEFGVKRYHQVSTDEVYGDLPLDRPDLFFTETTPLHTSSPYSSSKASADLFVLAYHRTFGLPVTKSRCSNNYCP